MSMVAKVKGILVLLAFLFLTYGVFADIAKAASSEYPSKPIDLVVPFAPGGSSDGTARLIAPGLAKKWKQPVNVVNMAGGSAITGTNHVIQSRPDGYTVLLDSQATSSMLGASRSDLPFKWDNQSSIARLFLEPIIFTVKGDAPWKTLKDVVAAIKADPRSFKWGSAGVGAVGTFSISELFNTAGINSKLTNRVIFNGGGPALTALAGGHVFLAGQPMTESLPLMSGGLIRAIAVVLDKRAPQIPEVPTAKEAGFPTLQVCGWTGLAGPPNMPKEIIQKWNETLKEIVADPEILKKAQDLGKVASYMNGEEYQKFKQVQYKISLSLAEEAGLRK